MRGPAASIALMLLAPALAGCAQSAIDMAPQHPDRPWTPAITADGEIVAGVPPPPDQPSAGSYVLPSNRALAGMPPPVLELERRLRPYTLPELIDIAESNNPTTRNAWNDARAAALAAGIAEATFLPRVSAAIVDGYLNSRSEGTILGLPVTTDLTARGTVGAVNLAWLLFDFGERASLVQAAKQGSVISNIAFTAAHQRVIYNVTLAFYAHAAARARLAAAIKSLSDAQAVQASAEDRYQRGIGTVVEVAQTRQATGEARLARVQADGAAQNSYLALISAIGIAPTTRLKIVDLSRRRLSTAMIRPVDRIVAEALARRPDVLTAYAAQRASLANLHAAEAAFLPKVFVNSSVVRATGDLNLTAVPGVGGELPIVNLPASPVGAGTSGTQVGTTTLVGVAMPIYDGGTRAAVLEQARTKVDKADTTLTQVRNEAVRQIVMAANDLKTSLSAYSAAKTLAAAARTTFDAALAAYRNGVGSVSDVTTAERQLLQANNAETDAYSAALSAAATLALAAGVLGTGPPQ